jgi:DNA-binding FrmR family transcriptional regulator
MVEDERYCIDVLTQLAAVTSALDGVGLLVLEDHVRHCVRAGGDEKVDEVIEAVGRLLRMR